MSDDEADEELLALLRQTLLGNLSETPEAETHVLESAEYVYNNSIDVALDFQSTRAAAAMIYDQMTKKEYSTKTWSLHELHPKTKDESTVAFIFTMDLLNFSFWSEKDDEERFAVEYQGKKWTGYQSLVAALQRALDEGQLRQLADHNGAYFRLKKFPSHLRTSGRTKMSVLKRLWSMFSGVQQTRRFHYFKREWPVFVRLGRSCTRYDRHCVCIGAAAYLWLHAEVSMQLHAMHRGCRPFCRCTSQSTRT
jgi:hypothetical protein